MLVLTMDPKHVIKRLRNNVFASGDTEGCIRSIKYNGDEIIWAYWRAAYDWDCIHNPEMMRIHLRLTNEYMEVSGSHLHLSSCLLPADCLDITYMCYEFRTPLFPGQLLQARQSELSVTSTQQSVNRWRHNEYSCCSHPLLFVQASHTPVVSSLTVWPYGAGCRKWEDEESFGGTVPKQWYAKFNETVAKLCEMYIYRVIFLFWNTQVF